MLGGDRCSRRRQHWKRATGTLAPLLALFLGSVLVAPARPGALPVADPGTAWPTATPTVRPSPTPRAPGRAPTPPAASAPRVARTLPGLDPLDLPLAPRPLPRLEKGDLNILLLGSDRRLSQGPSWRTDTIIVAAVRPRAGFVALFSIPRDLWVTIPGLGPQRINVADYYGETTAGPGGGPALVGAILKRNLGIPIHAYARIHFEGLEKIIDALGGITITSERSYDWWTDYGDREGTWHFHLEPGAQHVDGLTAMGYARDRTTTSDLDRSRRQQQILLAMRDAALRPATVIRLPQLLASLRGVAQTDLGVAQMLSLARFALRLGPGYYRTRVFDMTMVDDWVTPSGAMVLVPHWPAIREAWIDLTTP